MAHIFKIHFRCNNQGDGSVVVHFDNDKPKLESIEEDMNDSGEGWAESSVDTLKLKFEDGKLFFEMIDTETYQRVWKEAEVSPAS